MSSKPVVIYGASGYTGRLVAEFLREYKLPFVAAGRDRERIRAAMKQVSGIETADYDVVPVEQSVEALRHLFTGAPKWCATRLGRSSSMAGRSSRPRYRLAATMWTSRASRSG